MHHVLKVDPALIAIYFALMTITAPISGVIIGGIVTNYLGGYETFRG
jgi:hypothetical protein